MKLKRRLNLSENSYSVRRINTKMCQKTEFKEKCDFKITNNILEENYVKDNWQPKTAWDLSEALKTPENIRSFFLKSFCSSDLNSLRDQMQTGTGSRRAVDVKKLFFPVHKYT